MNELHTLPKKRMHHDPIFDDNKCLSSGTGHQMRTLIFIPSHIVISPLLVIVFATNIQVSSAQGFAGSRNQSDLDTLIESRVEFSKETYYLFHYLSRYQFYDFDEVNEFQKAKEMKQLQDATDGIRSGWQSRYKITFESYQSIHTNPHYGTWLLLSSYDFEEETFQVTFQDFEPIQVGGVNSQKLDAILKGKVPPTSGSARAFLALKLDPRQKKPYPLGYKPEVAETFKAYVEDNRIACDLLIDISGEPQFSTEVFETDGFQQFKQRALDNYKKSGGFVHTFDEDGIRRRKPHPLKGLSSEQRQRAIIKQFRSSYPDAETHYVIYSLDLPCTILGIRFLADKQKIFEWRPE